MKGDFTRDTFDAAKHFSRVLNQQGRVTLDADFNEQAAILLRTIRLLARDLIGPHAAPRDGGGFQLAPAKDGGFTIGAGRYWVDGIPIENAAECRYAEQPDWPVPADDPLAAEIKAPTGDLFWLYLDVWERLITWMDDPSIRETALGGPDTSARAKVVWQVRGLKVDKRMADLAERDSGRISACAAPLAGLPTLSHAGLAARIDPSEACYRGANNQLYRVEIHDGGAAGVATFKWSRDNGSRLVAWTGNGGNDELKVTDTRDFNAGAWVELTDDAVDLQGRPGTMVQLAKVGPGTLTLDPSSLGSTPHPQWTSRLSHAKARRWEQTQNAGTALIGGVIAVTEGTASKPRWIDLESGVQIAFSPGGVYRTGDYWLIPARVATGGIEWPVTFGADGAAIPRPERPRGIEHHYAPLGFLTLGDNPRFTSCRREIEAAGETRHPRLADRLPKDSGPLPFLHERVEKALATNAAYRALPTGKRTQIAHDTVRLLQFLLGGVDAGAASAKPRASDPFADLVGEVDFPDFVADLITGTFQAIVDTSIKQMDAYAELLKSVAKTIDKYGQDNVSDQTARDYLIDRYPKHLEMVSSGGTPKLKPKDKAALLHCFADLGVRKSTPRLDDDAVEGLLLAMARRRMATDRQQLLATMVMMGLKRLGQ